jgi:hypothetical protein
MVLFWSKRNSCRKGFGKAVKKKRKSSKRLEKDSGFKDSPKRLEKDMEPLMRN